jgi:hypothetical protein
VQSSTYLNLEPRCERGKGREMRVSGNGGNAWARAAAFALVTGALGSLAPDGASAQVVREQLKYENEVAPYHGGVRYFEKNGRPTIEIDVPRELPANMTLDDWIARKAAEEYVKYVKRMKERDPTAIVGPPHIIIQRIIRGIPVS